MITSTKNWNRQKNHDISIRHGIRHYSPYKATPLAEGEWNRRPIRVNLTLEGLELTSTPRKRLVPMLHFFPYWMTEGYRSRYQKYRVHWFYFPPLTQPKTPRTCCKLKIFLACCNVCTSLALWKHHVNLSLQSFRSVSLDLDNALLALMKIRAYGSKALEW